MRSGAFETILRALVKNMKERGNLDLTECFIDVAFVIAKRGPRGGKNQAGQRYENHGTGRPPWFSVTISVRAFSHEITLVESTLETIFTEELPKRLMGDKAYDNDPLDEKLAENGVELIASHRTNRKKMKTQDGENFADIGGNGKLRDYLHGFRIIDASWFGWITSRTTLALFIWVAW